ncbi:MAG: hypothetical protein ACQEQU_00650 [Spirochaetota bacterium]
MANESEGQQFEVEVTVNGKALPINPYVKQLFAALNTALLGTLKHTDDQLSELTVTLQAKESSAAPHTQS